jgi:lipopolysaccharide export system protein LptA
MMEVIMRNVFAGMFALTMMVLAQATYAQNAGIALSPITIDASQPVEVTADNLTVDQNSNSAVFLGNARVVQGDLILAADKIMVIYNAEQSAIERVEATTNVVFTNGSEIAEAQSGVYYVDQGTVNLAGDVVLVQGINAISGDALKMDLKTNRGTMSGNVRTVFVPKPKK